MTQHLLLGFPLFVAAVAVGTFFGYRALDRWTDRIEARRASAGAGPSRTTPR